MYVYYDLIVGREASYDVRNCSVPKTQYYPSECIWMVPGTVDPMAD